MVKNNIVIGRDNALRLFYIKSVLFENNTVFSKFLQINSTQLENSKSWDFKDNTYYTEKEQPFRVSTTINYSKEVWDSEFKLDINSQWKNTKEFDLEPVLQIAQHSQKPNTFNVVLLNNQGDDVKVDFSKYKVTKGSSYRIYDAENRNEILVSGIVNDSKKVVFPMNSNKFEMPLHNTNTKKTPSNFGVFMIEYDDNETTSSEDLSSFQKILKWLGF